MKSQRKLPCKLQIGEDVVVTVPPDCECAECSIRTAQNNEDPETIYAMVVSVRFTRAKVYYDIITDDTSEIIKDVDSIHCSSPKEIIQE